MDEKPGPSPLRALCVASEGNTRGTAQRRGTENSMREDRTLPCVLSPDNVMKGKRHPADASKTSSIALDLKLKVIRCDPPDVLTVR
jgi:hypothetical protein